MEQIFTYPIEDQINDCYKFFGIKKYNAWNMTDEEIFNCESELGKYFEWVEHPECQQLIPKHIETGKLIW